MSRNHAHISGGRGQVDRAALGWAAWTLQIAFKRWVMDRMNLQTLLIELKRLRVQMAAQEEE